MATGNILAPYNVQPYDGKDEATQAKGNDARAWFTAMRPKMNKPRPNALILAP